MPMAAFVLGFLPVLSFFGVGVALLAATARPGNEAQAKRERVWTLEVSPRGLCRLLGWALTVVPVWWTVGCLARRQPAEFLVGAAALLLAAKGIGWVKRRITSQFLSL